MREWVERILEVVRIFFETGQNRAFHMPLIGGGEEMFLNVLYRGMIAGGVVLAVLLLRMLLWRAPKIYHYLLWGLVLYWLLCPFTFVSTFSFLGAFGETDGARMQIEERQTQAVIQGSEIPEALQGGQMQETVLHVAWKGESVRLSRRNVLRIAFYVWAAGIAAMLLYGACSLVFLSRRLKGAVRMQDNTFLSDYVPMPFVIGVVRPRIYLPSSLQEKEKEYIIMHERTHIRRGDHVVRMLAFLALAVYWFHPLVWLAYYLSGKDMEMSCDEAVMRKMDRDIRADYATSLLNLATGRLFPGGTPLAFGEGDTKTRIKNVMRWRRPKPVAAAFSLAVVAMAAVVFGTDPWRADAREAGAGQAAGAENEELRLAADAWAKAFCDRDGNAIASLSTAEYQAYLIEEELLSGVDGDYYGFGWSSPWPWVSGKDYRIVDCTENRTVILYYAWTSVPHVTVWREHLTWEREEGEYRVSAGSLRYLNSISDSGDFAEAYGLGVNGTPIDFLTNGAGEALNENALQNGEYYQALFAPETAARFLLNVSDNEGDAALAAGSRQPDGSVEVAISFPADGGSAVVKMIQPYGEEGIWIVQDL